MPDFLTYRALLYTPQNTYPIASNVATSSTRRTVETDVCSSQSVQGSAHGGEHLPLTALLGAPTNTTMPSPGSVTPCGALVGLLVPLGPWTLDPLLCFSISVF